MSTDDFGCAAGYETLSRRRKKFGVGPCSMRHHVLLSSLVVVAACTPTTSSTEPKCRPETTPVATEAPVSSVDPASAPKSSSPKLDIELTPYAFLLGQWEPFSPAEAIGQFSFESDVHGRVIHRVNHTPSPEGRRDDLLTLYLTQKR